MSKKLLLLSLLVIFLSTLTAACTFQGSNSVPESKIRVAVSIYPLADITRQLGGDSVQVDCLLPPGATPHTYEITPREAGAISNAHLLVLVGQGLDNRFTRLAEEPAVLVVTEGIDLLEKSSPVTVAEDGDLEEDHTDDGFDPHVWLDPVLVRDEIAPRITAALIAADPGNEPYYQDNLEHFRQQLSDLDAEIRSRVAGFSSRELFVFHSAWGYFARRYGLEDVNLEEFPNQELTPATVVSIVETARSLGAVTLFAEPQFSSKAAETIAAEFGGQVVTLDPLGGENLAGRDSYIELMLWNLSRMQEGLSRDR